MNVSTNPYEDSDRVISETRDHWYASDVRRWFPRLDDPVYVQRVHDSKHAPGHTTFIEWHPRDPAKAGSSEFGSRPHLLPAERTWARAALLADEAQTLTCLALVQEFHARFKHTDRVTTPALEFLNVLLPDVTGASAEGSEFPVDARFVDCFQSTALESIHKRGYWYIETSGAYTQEEYAETMLSRGMGDRSAHPYEPLYELLTRDFGAFKVLAVAPYNAQPVTVGFAIPVAVKLSLWLSPEFHLADRAVRKAVGRPVRVTP